MRHNIHHPQNQRRGSLISRCFVVVLGFVGLSSLCVAPANAQTPDAKSPNTAAAVVDSKIDPKARVVWDRMTVAYRNLKTLRDVIELRVMGDQGDQTDGTQNSKTILDLVVDRVGGRAKVTKVAAGVTWLAVSDGVILQMTRSSNPEKYIKRPLDKSHAANTTVRDFGLLNVFKAVGESVPSFGILDGTLDSAAMVKQGMTSLSLGEPQIVGGAVVETLHATMTMSKRVEVTITIVCFQSDGLLSRVIVERRITDNGTTRRTRTIEVHTRTVVNRPLPDSVFAFTPPPTATAVTKFD